MLVYDVLDGRMVLVECGGEWGPVAASLDLVLEEVCSGGCGSFLFELLGVGARVSPFVKAVLERSHSLGGIIRGGTDFLGPEKLSVWDVVNLFGWVVREKVQVGVPVCGFAV